MNRRESIAAMLACGVAPIVPGVAESLPCLGAATFSGWITIAVNGHELGPIRVMENEPPQRLADRINTTLPDHIPPFPPVTLSVANK